MDKPVTHTPGTCFDCICNKDHDRGYQPPVHLCRLHAAAPEMASILRRLTGNPHEAGSLYPALDDARALLRRIEGS